MSDYWMISELKIESPDNRNSTEGTLLKVAWMQGVSDAVQKKGKVSSENYNIPLSSNNKNNKKDTTTQPQQAECYHRYTMLEAYTNMNLFYEAGETQGTLNADNTINNNQEKETVFRDDGNRYTFKVQLKDEGYTEWVIAIDSRANKKSVISAILSKKLKQAYQIASKSIGTDGLIPLSAKTFIANNKSVPYKQPPFIGHCRFGFDSGIEGDHSGDLTICLAVAPISVKTNKPSTDTVIKAIFNVTGDITGGTIGKLSANLKNLKNNTNNRYSYDDDDDKKDTSKEISNYLHKKFKAAGDQSMYDDYLKIRSFLKKCIDNKIITFSSITVGDGNQELKDGLENTIFKNDLVCF